MNFEETGFEGLYLIKVQPRHDERGYFMESYNKKSFSALGLDISFVQDNHSFSVKGVVRGLHFQRTPNAQTKLLRVVSGEILDIVLDLRRNQPTFGKPFVCALSSENKDQLLVPKGFAHGFFVKSDTADVVYKCDEFYYPESEGGINILDPDLGLQKFLPKGAYLISQKDRILPNFAESNFNF